MRDFAQLQLTGLRLPRRQPQARTCPSPLLRDSPDLRRVAACAGVASGCRRAWRAPGRCGRRATGTASAPSTTPCVAGAVAPAPTCAPANVPACPGTRKLLTCCVQTAPSSYAAVVGSLPAFFGRWESPWARLQRLLAGDADMHVVHAASRPASAGAQSLQVSFLPKLKGPLDAEALPVGAEAACMQGHAAYTVPPGGTAGGAAFEACRA